MPKLIVIEGNCQGQAFDLVSGKVFTIGRRSSNPIALDDKTLSREHCEVCHDGQETRLRDLESLHGTFVDGQRVQSVVLQDGQVIKVGHTILVYRKGDAAGAPASKDPEENEKTDAGKPSPVAGPASPAPRAEPSPPGPEAGGPSLLPPSQEKALVRVARKEVDAINRWPGADDPNKPPAASRPRRLLITGAAVATVGLLVGLGALLIIQHFSPPREDPLLPIDAQPDFEIRLRGKRKLLDRPPTYVVELEIRNKMAERQNLWISEFCGIDSAGTRRNPLEPASPSDLKEEQIQPGEVLVRSLNFEVPEGDSLSRVIFRNRWWIRTE